MNIIKRIGTDRHKFKLEFVMRKLKFSRHLPGKIYVSIRRGDHKMKTENLIEMNSNNECDLKKQIVTFPAITLFHDESDHKYQEKPGDMKILLVKDTGQKKLLGTVPFDVAEFVNSKRDTGLISKQSEQRVNIKKQVEEIPDILKMEATIEYNVFLKFIGEASQTDKSIKDEKVRSQSPFDKLKNFFFGNENEEQKPKETQSPRKISRQQPKRQSKEISKIRQRKQRERSPIEFQFQEEQQIKKPPTKQRISSDYNIPKPSQREKVKKKRQLQKQKELEEESLQNVKIKTAKKASTKIVRKPSPEANRQPDSSEQKQRNYNKEKQSKHNTSKKNQKDQNLEEQHKNKGNKNIVKQKERDTLTQYQEQGHKLSNYNKSQQPINKNHNQQNTNQFFFDDPTSFPPHLQPNYKKDKANMKNDDTNSPQYKKKAKDSQQKFKTDRQIKKQCQSQDEQQSFSHVQSKNTLSVPSPSRKVKQNSIQISSKDLHKEVQRKKKQDKSDNQSNELPVIPKNNQKGKSQKVKQPKEGKLPQPMPIKQNKTQKKQEELNSSEVKNLFTSFDEPPKKEQKVFVINPKKVSENQSSIFIKEELQKKQKDLIEMKTKLQGLQDIQKKLKAEQTLRQSAQKSVSHLKEQNKRLEKELERIKQQYDNLRSQHQSQSSIFRATQDHFLNKSEQDNLQEENKRLQRQKNQMIVNMTKQKEKHAKEVKVLKQDLEKQKMKYKQLENLSKIDLKKLKDENLKLSGNVEIMKDKNKQKVRQNETLLNQNKSLNTEVIQLKDKLGALKMKICEKLNEANEHGQSQLMQVLTELCEDM